MRRLLPRVTRATRRRWREVLIAVVVGLVVAGGLGVLVSRGENAQTDANDAQQRVDRIEALIRRQAAADKRLAAETAERRDQSCRLFEGQHLADVEQLRRTYDYLEHPAKGTEGLVPLILAQLPETERKARTDSAPAYCDEPGALAEAEGKPPVGLPEPDPVVPCRPKSIHGAPSAPPRCVNGHVPSVSG